MNLKKEDLIRFNLYDKLPENFKNLEEGLYYVFFYNVDEENLKLNIYEDRIVKQVNYTLYSDLSDISFLKYQLDVQLKIGFFSDTFETRDGLFFQFLNTYNERSDVDRLYEEAILQDKSVDVSISTNAISEIYNSDDFLQAISFFCPKMIQSIMLVYNMVDAAFKRKLSKKLYGSSIKKVVNLIKYNGGVLRELNNESRLRFMVIGEKANLNPIQLDELREAKFMLRSLVPLDDIYVKTGWAFSDKDGKWRTNIADDKASLSDTELYDFGNGNMVYRPDQQSVYDIQKLILRPESIYSIGYTGKLGNVLKHPTLFKYYPKLATIPIIYCFGDDVNDSTFYYSKNERGGYIVISGNKKSGSSLSILLHETQHAIQSIEDYATGGNDFLAKFVVSIGAENVRKVFSSINRMQRVFRENLLTNDCRMDLLNLVKQEQTNTDTAHQIKQELLSKLQENQYYIDNYVTINFYLILLISENGDISSSDILSYLHEKAGSVIYNLFGSISNGYTESKKFKEKLATQFREKDMGNILFSAYLNLYGEIESRSVQSSRYVLDTYKNYFYLTKWENAPLQETVIIDGIENILDCEKIKAAVEDNNKPEYVLHFEKGNTSVPIIHELGHIVYDALIQLGYSDRIKSAISAVDIEENFVSCFLDFIFQNIEDEDLRTDFRRQLIMFPNNQISEILEEFFSDEQADIRLKFLKTMLYE